MLLHSNHGLCNISILKSSNDRNKHARLNATKNVHCHWSFFYFSVFFLQGWRKKGKTKNKRVSDLPIFFHFSSFYCSFWRLLRDTMVHFPLAKGPAFFGGWFLHMFALFQIEKTSNPGLVRLVFDSLQLKFWKKRNSSTRTSLQVFVFTGSYLRRKAPSAMGSYPQI